MKYNSCYFCLLSCLDLQMIEILLAFVAITVNLHNSASGLHYLGQGKLKGHNNMLQTTGISV